MKGMWWLGEGAKTQRLICPSWHLCLLHHSIVPNPTGKCGYCQRKTRALEIREGDFKTFFVDQSAFFVLFCFVSLQGGTRWYPQHWVLGCITWVWKCCIHFTEHYNCCWLPGSWNFRISLKKTVPVSSPMQWGERPQSECSLKIQEYSKSSWKTEVKDEFVLGKRFKTHE